ncbi:NAD(+) synthetase [Campylobacter jejuni]|uniref:NH(3)-dependent NAD(+) synthetase n=2 Tax=Campylobacter jejuni TaxID=197 RepID=A0A5T1UHD8_CAMJU|nr:MULTISPECIES: NAD+ synthase [Campylobacter]EAH9355567.1 NAD+ synthase [Campylobacter coli]EAJ6188837.1 NAD+ synthase [Campylobacter fetus]WPM70907.1 NAD+ synthase [Campylobacter sp. CFSAN122719]AJK70930.1 NAD synthetase [Campylobacter jejuni subsp. jejuni]ALM59823.1 NAD(+) synthetase [Campylobacter jejuni]
MDWQKITEKMCDFIQEKVKNSQSQGVVLGLSGGIDSALVATLCKRALKENVFALLMPTQISNKANLEDALRLCADLNLEYKIIEIQSILDAFIKQSENTTLVSLGNFAARIRMSLLYDYSALKNSLVIGTSNKSELLLGYGTIYGDLACAFNPIGSLYKSEIYALAKYLNLHENFIKKAPSADLWENQSDEADLGFSYAKIDKGLKALETNDEKLLRTLDPSLIAMLKNRMQKNAFKGKMPEILEI